MIYAGYTPKKSSDEQYTPAYAVAPIIKYIPGNKIVCVRLIQSIVSTCLR